jgi:hypothetical protein
MDVDAKVGSSASASPGIIIVKGTPENGPTTMFFEPDSLT